MKKFFQEFFGSKLNIFLLASQVIALFFLCFANKGRWAFVLTLVFEAVFFVIFGIKTLVKNKEIDKNMELQSKLAIENINMERLEKRNKLIKKSNIFQAILYFFMGLALLFVAILWVWVCLLIIFKIINLQRKN